MEEVSINSAFSNTFPLFAARGARVLTPSGIVLGRVAQVQSDSNLSKLTGVVVKRGWSKIYIGREYFSQFNSEAFILKEEISLLLKDMKVISSEGQRVGRVVEVARVKSSNNISHLIVKGWMREAYNLKPSQIGSVGKSIILKGGVDVPKRSFWK